MRHLDALSRVQNILVLKGNSFEKTLAVKQMLDRNIKELRKLENGTLPLFELRNGIIYRKSSGKELQFYVPSELEFSIFHQSHNAMGHLGVDKCYNLIKTTYYITKLKDKLKQHISNCLQCIQFNSKSGKKEGELHSIPKTKVPFDVIHIDHYGPLSRTKRKNRYIFEIIDAFTKFIRFYATRNTTN